MNPLDLPWKHSIPVTPERISGAREAAAQMGLTLSQSDLYVALKRGRIALSSVDMPTLLSLIPHTRISMLDGMVWSV
jgi:hypothetical protein